MAYIYPKLTPRVTVKPLSKQAFAGGYARAIDEMQKQQMPAGMDPLRWREQQRANARYLGNVFSGGGGGPQAHDRPVSRGGFTPGIDPSYQQWQDQRYGAPLKPGFGYQDTSRMPDYAGDERRRQALAIAAAGQISMQAGQPRPGLGMGAGVLPPSGVAPTLPAGGLRQRGAVRPRPLRPMYLRPMYKTNV